MRSVGKCVGVWGKMRGDEERGLGGVGVPGEWVGGAKKCRRRCGEMLGEVWESVEKV